MKSWSAYLPTYQYSQQYSSKWFTSYMHNVSINISQAGCQQLCDSMRGYQGFLKRVIKRLKLLCSSTYTFSTVNQLVLVIALSTVVLFYEFCLHIVGSKSTSSLRSQLGGLPDFTWGPHSLNVLMFLLSSMLLSSLLAIKLLYHFHYWYTKKLKVKMFLKIKEKGDQV